MVLGCALGRVGGDGVEPTPAWGREGREGVDSPATAALEDDGEGRWAVGNATLFGRGGNEKVFALLTPAPTVSSSGRAEGKAGSSCEEKLNVEVGRLLGPGTGIELSAGS